MSFAACLPVRNDALAVALRDLAMILDPLGLKSAFAHALRGRADLVLRLKVDALRLKAAMIYAGVYVELGKPRVDVIGPPLNVKSTNVRLPDGLGERIDKLVGRQRRAAFIREVLEREVERRENEQGKTE